MIPKTVPQFQSPSFHILSCSHEKPELPENLQEKMGLDRIIVIELKLVLRTRHKLDSIDFARCPGKCYHPGRHLGGTF